MTLDQGGLATRLGQRLGRPRGSADGIECVWAFEAPARAREGGWRIVPDTHPHAIVHRLASGGTRATLVGARSRWLDVDPVERAWTVGVRLAPGTPTALTGERGEVFLDASVSLEEAFGADGRSLFRRLEECEEPDRALALLTGLLSRRLASARPVDWRARGLVQGGDESPSWSARRLGVSGRSLREVSAAWIGLSPKVVQRVRRLHRALGVLLRGGRATGATAAAEAGYTDQAHFIRDCRALLGETPEAFRARGRAGTYKSRRPD